MGDLDGDLLDREGQRRLGLRGTHPHGLAAVALHQPLADHLGQPLQRLVAALGRGKGDDVADLGVVDGVLEPVGQHRVAIGHVEGDVELKPLSDLLLGVADAVVGVDREPAQLHLDARLDPVAVSLHAVGNLSKDRGGDLHRLPNLRHIVDAEHVGALGGSENRGGDRAPEALARSGVVDLPMKLLREVPTTSGRPSARSSASRRSSSRLCSSALPKPDPGIEPDPPLVDPGRRSPPRSAPRGTP